MTNYKVIAFYENRKNLIDEWVKCAIQTIFGMEVCNIFGKSFLSLVSLAVGAT